MTLQKYRADTSETQPDGAVIWRANWIGGPSLARINHCRAENLHGEPRLTVYITGDADTWFSVPAKARYLGKVINGYVTGESDDGDNLVFRHCYF